MKHSLKCKQENSLVLTVMLLVGVLLIVQLWLLTGALEADLGGNHRIAWPAAIASGACLFLAWRLLRLLPEEEK